MSSINKLKNAWLSTDTQLSGTYQTCSLLNNGASEFAGNVIVDNKLAINRAVDGANNYKLDVSGNTRISDLVISNKNKLSNVQYIDASTNLTFSSAEYVCITSNCPTNSTIFLPLVTSSSQIGTKFTFFYNFDGYAPNVNIYTASGSLQTIVDNLYATAYNYILISYSRSYIELVCCNYTTNGICWALSNGSNDFSLFPQLIGVNNWSSTNTFNTILPTSTLTPTLNTQLITKAYADGKFQTITGMSSYLTTASASSTYLTTSSASSTYASLASPALSGNPTTTTQLTTDNSTRVASTAYVKSNLSSYSLTSDISSNYLRIIDASNNFQKISGMSAYLTSASASSTYQPISSMSNYVLTNDLYTYYSTTAYINNNYANLTTANTLTGSLTIDGTVALKNNTSVLNSKTFTITSGSTFNCNSGATANFNGTTNINSNGYWNVPTGSSFLLQGNGATWIELGPSALYSPISFNTSFNQLTLNGYIVFKTGFTIEGGQTIGIGTSGYGAGYIQVAGSGNGYINIQSSGGFFSNWVEPTSTTSSASWYSTHASSLAFGNSSATLSNNFASNTYSGSCSFVSLPSTTTAITTAGTDNFITKRIANLLYCGVQSPTVFTPTFKITAPFIPSGEIISTFSNDAGDTILIRNNGYGLTPNAMCIDTAQANGLSLNANTSTASINFHIAKTLIGKILSTGLSITGNISFTGSLGSITQTIFGNIATSFGKQTQAEAGAVITGNTTISAPFSQAYGVNNGTTTPIVITLPQASSANLGVNIMFRRLVGSTSTTIINITTTGSTQLIYTGNNGSATTVSIMASGVYVNRIISLYTGSSYNWHFN